MVTTVGRRERKKAATRQKIADSALRLFLQKGYDAVGIRDIAEDADVAVTTLFLHFPSKEALVFAQDREFEDRLVAAVGTEDADTPLIPALHQCIAEMVRHCAAGDQIPIRRMIDQSPALQAYEDSMLVRYAKTLAAAISDRVDQGRPTTGSNALARFVVDAYAIAREADDPGAALDETFGMINEAWGVARAGRA